MTINSQSIDSNEIRALSMDEIENVSGGLSLSGWARGMGVAAFQFGFMGIRLQVNATYGFARTAVNTVRSAVKEFLSWF